MAIIFYPFANPLLTSVSPWPSLVWHPLSSWLFLVILQTLWLWLLFSAFFDALAHVSWWFSQNTLSHESDSLLFFYTPAIGLTAETKSLAKLISPQIYDHHLNWAINNAKNNYILIFLDRLSLPSSEVANHPVPTNKITYKFTVKIEA